MAISILQAIKVISDKKQNNQLCDWSTIVDQLWPYFQGQVGIMSKTEQEIEH